MASKTTKFATSGMHCPSCAMLIEMALGDLAGVVTATSDYRTGVTEVTYDADVLTDEAVADEITKAGYAAGVA